MWLKHFTNDLQMHRGPSFLLCQCPFLQLEQWCMKYHVLIVMISLGQFASLRDSCVESYVSAKNDI